jgi:hypothetical protein
MRERRLLRQQMPAESLPPTEATPQAPATAREGYPFLTPDELRAVDAKKQEQRAVLQQAERASRDEEQSTVLPAIELLIAAA